jgi:hypothetical protein
MKVYVVVAFSAEPYSEGYWVDSVWLTLAKAEKYLEENPGPLGQNLAEFEYGYYLSSTVVEREVQ